MAGWGGKRLGAGRKAIGTKEVRVRLTESQHEIFKTLGGSKWLQDMIMARRQRINTKAMSDEDRDAFVEGWEDAGGYMDDLDSPSPWCCPWYWQAFITVSGDTPYEWGKDWWKQNKRDIEQALKEADESY